MLSIIYILLLHGWVQMYSIPKFVAEVILDCLPF